jgi:hypothetical protein
LPRLTRRQQVTPLVLGQTGQQKRCGHRPAINVGRSRRMSQ